MEEDHGRSWGPQHTPAGPHSVGGEEPGSVLWTEDPVREAQREGEGRTGMRVSLGALLWDVPPSRGQCLATPCAYYPASEGESSYWGTLLRSLTEKLGPSEPQKAFKV